MFCAEDVLADDKGECVICFDDLVKGDTIARLPCLCVYHKGSVLPVLQLLSDTTLFIAITSLHFSFIWHLLAQEML